MPGGGGDETAAGGLEVNGSDGLMGELIYKLDLDLEEGLDELGYDEGEGYISSSCSISMSSDLESSHQITVPVFVEPTPPEIRFPAVAPAVAMTTTTATASVVATEEPSSGLPPDLVLPDLGVLLHEGGRPPRIAHQETMHTDSGLDTEDICPASPTNSRFSADIPPLDSPSPKGGGFDDARRAFDERRTVTGFEDESLRLVLVRDIGIQCCAESPNLNLHRRHRSADEGEESADRTKTTSSLQRNYSAELLF